MEMPEIFGYIATALGGGGIATLLNWRLNKKRGEAEVQGNEIDNINKVVESVYKPIIDSQNKRIADLQHEVDNLRKERAEMEQSYRAQIASLQKQITDITRALGIKAQNVARGKDGRFIQIDTAK